MFILSCTHVTNQQTGSIYFFLINSSRYVGHELYMHNHVRKCFIYLIGDLSMLCNITMHRDPGKHVFKMIELTSLSSALDSLSLVFAHASIYRSVLINPLIIRCPSRRFIDIKERVLIHY